MRMGAKVSCRYSVFVTHMKNSPHEQLSDFLHHQLRLCGGHEILKINFLTFFFPACSFYERGCNYFRHFMFQDSLDLWHRKWKNYHLFLFAMVSFVRWMNNIVIKSLSTVSDSNQYPRAFLPSLSWILNILKGEIYVNFIEAKREISKTICFLRSNHSWENFEH